MACDAIRLASMEASNWTKFGSVDPYYVNLAACYGVLIPRLETVGLNIMPRIMPIIFPTAEYMNLWRNGVSESFYKLNKKS